MTDARKTVFPHNTYGDPDSPLYGHGALRKELEAYRRVLAATIPFYVTGKARERIMKAADEMAWARARERYAAIKEMPDWRLEDFVPQRLRPRG